ncbi:unnamed protein product [Caenorhabditis sp. 36 PRJEB53466]|nr:unnamed protein product [Caenorhabditis sp. 36 PRJEB53466]
MSDQKRVPRKCTDPDALVNLYREMIEECEHEHTHWQAISNLTRTRGITLDMILKYGIDKLAARIAHTPARHALLGLIDGLYRKEGKAVPARREEEQEEPKKRMPFSARWRQEIRQKREEERLQRSMDLLSVREGATVEHID